MFDDSFNHIHKSDQVDASFNGSLKTSENNKHEMFEERKEISSKVAIQPTNSSIHRESSFSRDFLRTRKHDRTGMFSDTSSEAQNSFLLQYYGKLKCEVQKKIGKNISEIEHAENTQKQIQTHRDNVYKRIDEYFERAIQILRERCSTLKEQYESLENSELERLEYKMNILKESNESLSRTLQSIEDTLNYTPLDSCFLENKTVYKSLLNNFMSACKIRSDKTFFKPCSFEFPSFDCLEEDLSVLTDFGRIKDNSYSNLPIVIFNTYKFQMLQYDDSQGKFTKCKIVDESNTITNVPKYFKYQVTSHDEVILLGGSKQASSKRNTRKKSYVASNLAFRVYKGEIMRLDYVMKKPRQYFNLVLDKTNKQIFIIGGFNEREGALSSCEKLCLKTYKFSSIAPMKQKRYN